MENFISVKEFNNIIEETGNELYLLVEKSKELGHSIYSVVAIDDLIPCWSYKENDYITFDGDLTVEKAIALKKKIIDESVEETNNNFEFKEVKTCCSVPGILNLSITEVPPVSVILDKIMELSNKGYALSSYDTYGNDEEMILSFVYVGEVNSDKAKLTLAVAKECAENGTLIELDNNKDIKFSCKGQAIELYPELFKDGQERLWIFNFYDEETGIIQDYILIDDGNGYYSYYDYVR